MDFPPHRLTPHDPAHSMAPRGPKRQGPGKPWCGGRDSYNSCGDFYRKRTNPLKKTDFESLRKPAAACHSSFGSLLVTSLGFHGSRQSTVVSNTFFTSERNPIFGIDDLLDIQLWTTKVYLSCIPAIV